MYLNLNIRKRALNWALFYYNRKDDINEIK
nr:MAG TPA: hypothetical protein [Caudoviricetes sp.]